MANYSRDGNYATIAGMPYQQLFNPAVYLQPAGGSCEFGLDSYVQTQFTDKPAGVAVMNFPPKIIVGGPMMVYSTSGTTADKSAYSGVPTTLPHGVASMYGKPGMM